MNSQREREVCFTWMCGDHSGRVCRPSHRFPATAQNCLGMIAIALGQSRELEVDLRHWFATVLLPGEITQGNVERFPEFCPVFVKGQMVAVLLRQEES